MIEKPEHLEHIREKSDKDPQLIFSDGELRGYVMDLQWFILKDCLPTIRVLLEVAKAANIKMGPNHPCKCAGCGPLNEALVKLPVGLLHEIDKECKNG